MTIQRVNENWNFIGLSTDTKDNITRTIGSTFYETNTGKKWIWDGVSWVEDLELIYALSQILGT
ncbi:MAG: hypothetical protein ABIL62_12095 [Planctomycetota bacterium]